MRGSLARMKINRLHGLLLQQPNQLLTDSGEILYQTLAELKGDNLVSNLGISIYDPRELDALWKHYRFDKIQAPFNVVDRRLINSGWLARLQKTDTEVHVRSIFLQGLLLMRLEDRPEEFGRWQAIVACDSSGRVVDFEIQEGKGDIRNYLIDLGLKWKTEVTPGPVMVFDREGYGGNFFMK